MLEQLRHPNLVRMLDVIWSDDDVYLVLELINGGEFFEYCMAAGALPEPTAQVKHREARLVRSDVARSRASSDRRCRPWTICIAIRCVIET